jgi:hypothetical protein
MWVWKLLWVMEARVVSSSDQPTWFLLRPAHAENRDAPARAPSKIPNLFQPGSEPVGGRVGCSPSVPRDLGSPTNSEWKATCTFGFPFFFSFPPAPSSCSKAFLDGYSAVSLARSLESEKSRTLSLRKRLLGSRKLNAWFYPPALSGWDCAWPCCCLGKRQLQCRTAWPCHVRLASNKRRLSRPTWFLDFQKQPWLPVGSLLCIPTHPPGWWTRALGAGASTRRESSLVFETLPLRLLGLPICLTMACLLPPFCTS